MRKLILVVAVLLLLGGCAAFQQQEPDQNPPIVDSINTIRAVNAASAPFNPWALPIETFLGTVTLMIGAYAAAKRKEANLLGLKYEAHKRAVEAEMRNSTPEIANALYEAIGEERKNLNIK